MAVRAVALLVGLLMTGAIGAAEDQTSFSGKSFTVDAAGVIECSGDCVVKFRAPIAFDKSESATVTMSKVSILINNMQFVSDSAEIRTLADGVTELRAERIRITRVLPTP